jgi:hypothetical protein
MKLTGETMTMSMEMVVLDEADRWEVGIEQS